MMEASSPLAAMHRPTAAGPFGRRDLFTSLRVRLSPGKPPARSGGSGIFSIRDQLNQESFGPVHGSSPAGSLAADLCQNFTIGEDSSPRFPTPRRALFTTCQSNAGSRGFSKASPLPVSSSPLPVHELMDMTPIPNKKSAAAFVAEREITPSSPASPLSSDEMMLESPCPGPLPAVVAEPARPAPIALERRKLPRRTSLTRAKGYSFAGPSSGRLHSDNQLPFFRFGESRFPPLLASSSASNNTTAAASSSGTTCAIPATTISAASVASSTSATASSSSLSVSECFQESPPQHAMSQPFVERRPQTSHSPCVDANTSISASSSFNGSAGVAPAVGPIRSRPSFVSTSSAASAASSRTGSPIAGHHGHIRRQSSSFVRPRRQYRRSLSMFENPIDMMKPKRDETAAVAAAAAAATAAATVACSVARQQQLQPSLLASVMDTDEPTPAAPTLPHFFPEGQTDSIPRIDRSTLLRVLDGDFNDAFEHKLIIDCRFEYEYAGGHINEAINYNDKDLLATHLFGQPLDGRSLIVLHCEYSAHRAPLMARHIRAEDRAHNAEHYPRLTYPELYILDGGYSGFFGEHPCRCYPQAYVEMGAAEHAFACEREMGRLKQSRKGLHRAQTFAFGQHDQRIGDKVRETTESKAPRSFYALNDVSSPTAPGRATNMPSSPCMMMGASPILGCDRGHGRRMASY